MRKEIIFTGFGGQGIILMGVIIARMMEHFPELEVTQAQSYGPASGAARAAPMWSFPTRRSTIRRARGRIS